MVYDCVLEALWPYKRLHGKAKQKMMNIVKYLV